MLSTKALKSKHLFAIIAVAAAVLATVIPWWIHSRSLVMENACIDNLRSIDAAKNQWALESLPPPTTNETPTWGDLAPYLENVPSFWWAGGFCMPKYPPHAIYNIGPIDVSPKCTYSGHTIALEGIMVQVGDASINSKARKVFEFYDLPGGLPGNPRRKLRLVGSIIGASVGVLDESGHWIKVETGEDGTASLDTFSNKPVAIVVSKEGFLTSSNSVRDPYRYDYNILLKKENK